MLNDDTLTEQSPTEPDGIAPLLRALMQAYAATGLPPAFIPKDDDPAKPQPQYPTEMQE